MSSSCSAAKVCPTSRKADEENGASHGMQNEDLLVPESKHCKFFFI